MLCTPCPTLIKVLLCSLLVGISPGWCQTAIECQAARVKGTVTDDVEGMPIPGVDVTIVGRDDRVLTTISGASGAYCAGGLRRGKPVKAVFRKNGYLPDPREFDPIELSVAETHLDVRLYSKRTDSPYVNRSLRLFEAHQALGQANKALSRLASRDSIFLEPALAVNTVDEQFQVEMVSTAAQKVKAARDVTEAIARKRRDRLSNRDDGASAADVDTALDGMDAALKKLAQLAHQ